MLINDCRIQNDQTPHQTEWDKPCGDTYTESYQPTIYFQKEALT